MTGPQHYRESQRLLALVAELAPADAASEALLVQRAQVHATLALAAATALRRHDGCEHSGCDLPDRDFKAWYAAASTGGAA